MNSGVAAAAHDFRFRGSWAFFICFQFFTMSESTYWDDQLQLLVGKKVTAAWMQYDDDFDGEAPVLKFDDGTKLMMLSDEEGNGPGRFEFL